MQRWFAGLAADLRYALRGIGRYPSFSLTVIATLAVGIGVNAAVFAIASAVLLRGFPLVEDNDGLVYIASQGAKCCVSYPDFADLRERATAFEGLEVVHGFPATFTDSRGLPEVFDATEVSTGTFRLVGQKPLLGRDFTLEDEAPGAATVVVLSHGFWQRRYARDPDILGETIRLNGMPATIIGVMPQGFSFPMKQELWLPIVPTPEVQRRDRRNLWFVFGRLREGATVETARAQIKTIGLQLAAEYPLTNQANDLPEVLSFNEFFVGSGENAIYGSMWGAVVFVLLIACANLANLLLARAIGRSREISVRIALGASRQRIARQLVTESVLLSLIGGVFGWWLAKLGVRAYELFARGPGWSSWRVLDYAMDYRILVYLTVVSVATGLLFGLAPARKLSRLDVNASLKEGGPGATAGARAGRSFEVLVVAQVALAVVLLAGAGVMIRSFLNVTTANLGVTTENVSAAFISLPEARYPSGTARAAFYDEIDRRLESRAGIESVAFADMLPTWGSVSLPYELGGVSGANEASRPRVAALVTSPGYFRTLGATLLSGREFDDRDRGDSIPVAIVNQRFADEHWPGEEVLGKRLRVFDETEPIWLTVVGVVSSIVQNDATRQSFEAVVYLPLRQRSRDGMWVLVRALGPFEGLGADLRREIQTLDADLAIRFGPYTLSDRLAERYADRGLYAMLFFLFAAMALLFAAVGLYAVVAHSVSQHTKEIGVRVAMGARARDVLRLVLRIGLVPTGIGLGLGLALSFALTGALQSELVNVSPADPAAYVLACAVLGAAAALGCLIPARRATRIDPVIALRHD